MYPTRFLIAYPVIGVLSVATIAMLAAERVPSNVGLWVVLAILASGWMTAGVRIAISSRLEEGETAKPNRPSQIVVGLIVAGTGPPLVGRFVDHIVLLWICSVSLAAFATGFLGTALFLWAVAEPRAE